MPQELAQYRLVCEAHRVYIENHRFFDERCVFDVDYTTKIIKKMTSMCFPCVNHQ